MTDLLPSHLRRGYCGQSVLPLLRKPIAIRSSKLEPRTRLQPLTSPIRPAISFQEKQNVHNNIIQWNKCQTFFNLFVKDCVIMSTKSTVSAKQLIYDYLFLQSNALYVLLFQKQPSKRWQMINELLIDSPNCGYKLMTWIVG